MRNVAKTTKKTSTKETAPKSSPYTKGKAEQRIPWDKDKRVPAMYDAVRAALEALDLDLDALTEDIGLDAERLLYDAVKKNVDLAKLSDNHRALIVHDALYRAASWTENGVNLREVDGAPDQAGRQPD